MTSTTGGSRWKAGAAAMLLVLCGVPVGVAVDRLLLAPPPVEAMPLTAAALSDHLGLTPAEETRIAALLDSLHADVTAATRQGPDSLRAVADEVHRRLEAALPASVRPAFQAWLAGHHQRMMERIEGGHARMHEAMHPR